MVPENCVTDALRPDTPKRRASKSEAARMRVKSVTILRAEYASLGAGVRHCAVCFRAPREDNGEEYSDTAEDGRRRRNPCPLGRWLGDMNTYSASRVTIRRTTAGWRT